MRRRVVVVLVFGLLSGVLWTAAAAARGEVAPEHEATFAGRIGDERAAAGVGGLTVAPDLVDVARRHAQRMADEQRLHHNGSLGREVANWQRVGENVGRGTSVEQIHQAFMASSSHRDNILDANFTEVGIGVVADGQDLWVVEVFRLPRPAPAPEPEPEPAPAPAATEPPPSSSDERDGDPSDGGEVRAASASRPPAPAPAPVPTPAVPAPTTTAAPEPVPTTAAPATTAAPEVPVLPATTRATDLPATTTGVVGSQGRGRPVVATGQPPRDVTLPIGLAAGLLVVVVGGLAWQVATEQTRSATGPRRSSVVDVWELALAA